MPDDSRCVVGGPWFDELAHGQVFDDAPPVTITSGHAAMYQAITGDRLRLCLDHPLARAVTGRAEAYAHPLLVCHLVIGQTTFVTQRVIGNLFYRGLVMRRPVHIGDTLTTVSEVVALKQNRSRPSGLVGLRVRAVNQDGEAVLDYHRCPMLPMRDPEAATGWADDLDAVGSEIDLDDLGGGVPPAWRLEAFRDVVRTEGWKRLTPGTTYHVEARDTVTSAPELARLTLNMAATHTDATVGPFGERLVYGGHTISVAGAQILRALPDLVTILAWRSCDHTGPVFEGDLLQTDVTVSGVHPCGSHALVDLHAVTYAQRPDGSSAQVLDWRSVGVMA